MSRTAAYARGHKETSTEGKWDPGGYDMNAMRADTQAVLDGEDMPTADEIANAVWSKPMAQNIDGQPDTVPASTILTRINPGPYGFASGVANAVWGFFVSSPVDASKQTVVTILRWAYGNTDRLIQMVSDLPHSSGDGSHTHGGPGA